MLGTEKSPDSTVIIRGQRNAADQGPDQPS
jgi:hypothetical protein